MTHKEVEQAVAFYKTGYTCAQSILASFAARYGLQQNLAFRIGEPFGAGISCTGELCGSLSAAIMVLGLQYGSIYNDDNEARSLTYRRVQELIARFKKLHGSIHCTDLLGYDLSDQKQLRAVEQKDLFMQVCPGLVRDAAQILDEMLERSPDTQDGAGTA